MNTGDHMVAKPFLTTRCNHFYKIKENYAFVIFAISLGLNIWFVCNGWRAPISDRHEFRQSQTAIAAREVARNGLAIENYVPVFGPPWNIPMEFPLYQNIVGVISGITGYDVVQVARALSLLSFYSLLPALYLLFHRLRGEGEGGWLFLSLVVTSPLYLFWSRTVMIESFALCFSVWGIWFLIKSLDSGGLKWGATASLILTIGGLVKITTLFVWLCVSGVWWACKLAVAAKKNESFKRVLTNYSLRGGIPVLLSLIVSYAWIKYGDAIKSGNPLTAGLTSGALKKWNYGSWDQFSINNISHWIDFIDNIYYLGGWSFCFFILMAVLFRRYWFHVAICSILFLTPILVFTNLYFVHDYYYYANGLLLLAAIAIVLNGIMQEKRFCKVGKIVLLGLIAWNQYNAADYYLMRNRLKAEPPQLAAGIQKLISEDGIVISYGFSWSPALAYYSDRRFVMIVGKTDIDIGGGGAVLRLIPGGVSGMVVNSVIRKDRVFVQKQVDFLGLNPIPAFTTTEGDLYVR